MDLANPETLVGQLERSPQLVPLYNGELEMIIATLMEGIYQLSLIPADNDRKI